MVSKPSTKPWPEMETRVPPRRGPSGGSSAATLALARYSYRSVPARAAPSSSRLIAAIESTSLDGTRQLTAPRASKAAAVRTAAAAGAAPTRVTQTSAPPTLGGARPAPSMRTRVPPRVEPLVGVSARSAAPSYAKSVPVALQSLPPFEDTSTVTKPPADESHGGATARSAPPPPSAVAATAVASKRTSSAAPCGTAAPTSVTSVPPAVGPRAGKSRCV